MSTFEKVGFNLGNKRILCILYLCHLVCCSVTQTIWFNFYYSVCVWLESATLCVYENSCSYCKLQYVELLLGMLRMATILFSVYILLINYWKVGLQFTIWHDWWNQNATYTKDKNTFWNVTYSVYVVRVYVVCLSGRSQTKVFNISYTKDKVESKT